MVSFQIGFHSSVFMKNKQLSRIPSLLSQNRTNSIISHNKKSEKETEFNINKKQQLKKMNKIKSKEKNV